MNEQQKVANEIFKSIDIITNKKIEDTPFSTSITGRVVERIKGSDMYKVNYQNEEIRALSMGAAYNQGDMVIILVPDKRMDSLKFILGRANDRTPTISVSQTGGLSPAILAEIQAALEIVNDIGSDDKITPSEKTTLSIQWSSLSTSFSNLIDSLEDYETIDGSTLVTRYNALRTVMDSILSNMSTTIDFSGAELRTLFGSYYAEEQALRTSIIEFIESQTLYKVELISSNGSQFINGDIQTVLVAQGYRGLKDITSTLPNSSFVWRKKNYLGVEDTAWNAAHIGVGNSIEITSDDMNGKAIFTCELHIDEAIVSTAQVTMIDISDARTLQAFISSSQPYVQIFDNDTSNYIPNWALTPPVLTPSMYVSGSTANIIDEALSIEWYKDGVLITEATPNHHIGAGYSLNIVQNMLTDKNFVTYTLRVTYFDNSTGLTITDSETVEFAKIQNGGTGSDGLNGENAQVAYLLTPDGTVFKNERPTDKKRLEVRYFDGIYEQHNNLTVKWFYADPTVEVGDPNYDADAGTGWSKISHTNDANGSYTNYTTKIMSVSRNGVDGTETFKALVKYGNKPFYSALGTIVDIFDPHQVVIEGDATFKNGVGTLKLKARVFLDSEEITDFTGYSFLWTAYDSNGNEISTFNRNTQEVEISSTEVPDKGYLACDIFKT